MSLFWDILNVSYSARLGWTGWLHGRFTFSWREQCPSLIFAAVANTLFQSNFAREVSLGLQFQVTVIMKGSQDKTKLEGRSACSSTQCCIQVRKGLHCQRGMAGPLRMLLVGCQAGFCSASFLIQSRTICLWNSDAHSRPGPPISIKNQDSPPQTCPKTNLI